MTEDMTEDITEDMTKDMAEDMAEDMVEDMTEHMTEDRCFIVNKLFLDDCPQYMSHTTLSYYNRHVV